MWKVMSADDEPYVREGLEKLIPWRELGYELIFQARNGRELIERMEEERPDVVIVDIRMPVMGGLEVAEYLAEKGWPTKVIILTAYADFEYARQALRHKVSDYVVKTAALDEIPRILRRISGELREHKPAVYRMLLLYGLTERGDALSRIVDSCFDQEVHSSSPAGEKGYYIVLFNSLLPRDELLLRCRKLLDLTESFLGQRARLCVGRIYHDERETAEVYDHTYEYMINNSTGEREDVLFAEETPPAQPSLPPAPPEDAALSGPESTDLAERTQLLIEKHFCSRLTLVELAEEVHANPSYLSRLYKQKTGENLFDVINRRRIEKAKEYISLQNRKIYEIAELVGFEDTAYFSRVFRKFTGMSPREYEKHCRTKREGEQS